MSAALEGFVGSMGHFTQESVKSLLRSLFGEEADLTTVVNSLPKTGSSNPGVRSSASLKAGVSGEKKADPQPATAPMQWMSVDLSTEFPISQVKSTTTAVRAATPPSTPSPPLPEAHRTAGWVWAAFSTAVLTVGVGLTLLALRPPWARDPRVPSVVLPGGSQPSPLVSTRPSPPTTVAVAPAPATDVDGSRHPRPPLDPLPRARRRREREPPKEARHAARPAAKASTGTVMLRVNPWAEVFYADKTLGVTPMAALRATERNADPHLEEQGSGGGEEGPRRRPREQAGRLRVNLLDGM